MRLGLAREQQGPFEREVGSGVTAVAAARGWTVTPVDDAAGEAECDVLLATGNPTVYPDLVLRPRAAPRVLWYVEALYTKRLSRGPFHRYLPTGRMLDIATRLLPPIERRERFVRARENAAIVRETVANVGRLKHATPAYDRMVTDARDRLTVAAEYGLRLEHIPLGYHQSYAGPLVSGGERDIAAFFLGYLVGRVGRRQRLLKELRADLWRRGVELSSPTGDLYGPDRQRTLATSRVVVDLHRIPGNFNEHRFVFATAAGAALVTEPLADSAPLIPGVHYIECPAERMGETIAAVLADEPQRRRVVDAAQELLRTEMSMEVALPRVLGQFGQA